MTRTFIHQAVVAHSLLYLLYTVEFLTACLVAADVLPEALAKVGLTVYCVSLVFKLAEEFRDPLSRLLLGVA